MGEYDYIEPDEISKELSEAIDRTRQQIRDAFRMNLPPEPSEQDKRTALARLKMEEKRRHKNKSPIIATKQE